MAIGIRKLSTICAAIVALVGLGGVSAKATSTTSQQSSISQNAPLILEHGSAMHSQDSAVVLAEHYSHSSHESHASHVSHYSSRY